MLNLLADTDQQFLNTINYAWDNVDYNLYTITPVFEFINYFNLLGQLQIVLFYKQFNKNWQYSDIFLQPYTEFAVEYYQDKLTTSINNMFNTFCPIKAFYNFRGE